MHVDAQIGFHQYATVGEDSGEIAMLHDSDRRVLLDAGVLGSFVERAFTTPHDDLWLPGPQALYTAHVITQSAGSIEHFEDAHSTWYVESAEAVLSKNPMLAELHAVDPVEYSRYRAWIQARFGLSDTVSAIKRDLALLLAELFTQRVGLGSDSSVIELGQVVLRELKIASKLAPVYCDAFRGVADTHPANKMENAIGPQLIAEEQKAVARVIATSATLPRPEIADMETRMKFLSEVKARHQSSDVLPRTASIVNASCEELVFILEAMLAQPKCKAASLLRYWLRFHTLELGEAAVSIH
jgi:hypothetical protein